MIGKETNRRGPRNQKAATLCLALALFFNPAGYDVIFKMVLDLTGSYWQATHVFYLIAGLFLGLSFYFSRVNPLNIVYGWCRSLVVKIKSLFA